MLQGEDPADRSSVAEVDSDIYMTDDGEEDDRDREDMTDSGPYNVVAEEPAGLPAYPPGLHLAYPTSVSSSELDAIDVRSDTTEAANAALASADRLPSASSGECDAVDAVSDTTDRALPAIPNAERLRASTTSGGGQALTSEALAQLDREQRHAQANGHPKYEARCSTGGMRQPAVREMCEAVHTLLYDARQCHTKDADHLKIPTSAIDDVVTACIRLLSTLQLGPVSVVPVVAPTDDGSSVA